MLGQLDMAGHPEVGLGLLLATAIAPDAAAVNIALVPLMTAHGIGIALVVVFAEIVERGNRISSRFRKIK